MNAFEGFRADIVWDANTGQAITDLGELGAVYGRTTATMSDDALRAALAQEKLVRAIKTGGPESISAQRATLAYRAEMRALATAANEAAAAETKQAAAARESAIASRTASRTGTGGLLAQERAAGRFVRGGFVGSGVGRSGLLFGSTAFVGGLAAVSGLKAVLDAAKSEDVALGQLRVSLEDTGHSWETYSERTKAALSDQVKSTGFTNDQLTTSLAQFVRRFGDVDQALRANAIAADVARAKNISLADAQTLVMRASFGNPRSLRILGIELAKTTSNYDQLTATTKHASQEQIAAAKAADLQANELSALDQIQAKYHGNAARYLQTTAGRQALFNAELKQTEEEIGQALLPTFNHLLAGMATYLGRADNQQRIQRDVNQAVKEGTVVFHLLANGIHGVANAVSPLVHALGGFQQAAEVAFGAVLLRKFTAARGGLTGLLAELRLLGPTAVAASTTADAALNSIGTTANANALQVAGLVRQERLAGTVSPLATRVGSYTGGLFPVPTKGGTNYRALLPAARKAGGAAAILALISGKGGATTSKLAIAGYLAATGNPELALGYLGLSFNTQVSSALGFPEGVSKEQATQLLRAAANGQLTLEDLEKLKGFPGFPEKLYTVAKGLMNARYAGAMTDQPVRGRDVPSRFAPQTKPGPAKPPPLVLGLTYRQQNQLLVAQGTPGTADDRRILNQQLGILNKAIAQKGLTPLQRNQLLASRNSTLSQIDAIDRAAKSASDEAQRKVDALRKKAAARRAKEHKTLLATLEQAPVQLRIELQTAIAHGASEAKQLAILREERAAIEKQIGELKKIGAGKDAILKARTNEATIQKKIDAITKKKAVASGANEAQFLSSFRDIIRAYAPNAFPLPAATSGGKAETHLYDLVHETRRTNGHLRSMAARGRFPASDYAREAAFS